MHIKMCMSAQFYVHFRIHTSLNDAFAILCLFVFFIFFVKATTEENGFVPIQMDDYGVFINLGIILKIAVWHRVC